MYARAIYPHHHQLLGRSRGGGSACYGDESTGKTISEQLRELRLRALATVCTDHYDHNVGAMIFFPDIFAEIAGKYPYLSIGVNLGKVCASLMNSSSAISGKWQITYIQNQKDREVSGSDGHPI